MIPGLRIRENWFKPRIAQGLFLLETGFCGQAAALFDRVTTLFGAPFQFLDPSTAQLPDEQERQ